MKGLIEDTQSEVVVVPLLDVLNAIATKFPEQFTDVFTVDIRVCQIVRSSVSDPSHFDVDPDPDSDPGIHIWEKWIRILGSTFPKYWIQIQILGSIFGKSESGSEYLFSYFSFRNSCHTNYNTYFCYGQNLEKAFLR